MRRISDDQRRARLAHRHALAGPGGSVEGAVAAVTCLHATEPANMYLSAWARCGASRGQIDQALYEDRTVVRQLAMRRTVFAFPRELVPAVWGSAAARVAAQQERQLIKEIETAGLTDDGPGWVREHTEAALTLLKAEGPLGTAEVRRRLPALDARITRGKGTYQAEVAIARQVLTVLGAAGRILRGANEGGWKTSRPLWTAAEDWLGEEVTPLAEMDGYRLLVERWLRRFGPGTEDDLVWWLGATKAAVRRALADLDAVAVSLDRERVGYLLPDDLDDDPETGGWAALLPALDPTTMGWKERGFYLGDHADRLFDRNGNGGPTAWWGGRIVGGWTQTDDGTVEVVPAEALSRAAHGALAERAAELTAWLDGDVVRSIYQSPLVRASAGSSSR